MEFIQNSGPGTRLEQLSKAAVQEADSVIAAVAYVTDIQTLIASCWKHQKPLTLFARYDYSSPVSDEALHWFPSKAAESANYQMLLVPDIFHPKVIWWRGVGAYIGSANLSKSAWAGNVEAGVFLSEEDLDDNDMRPDLEAFFGQVQGLAHPLTAEVAKEMAEAGAGAYGAAQARAENQFEKTRRIPRQHSLISITKHPAKAKNRATFLKEWAATLQYLRDIGHRVSLPTNRPVWVPAEASPGVVADQFLHAFYYNQVRDGQNYPYHEQFKLNSGNREAALQKAIDWWRALPAAPSNEDIHIREWAPAVRAMLASKNLMNLNETSFQDLCLRVHAVRDHAKRVRSTTLGLQQGMHHMVQDDRIKVFAKWLYRQRSQDKTSCCAVIDFVLHGGSKAELPDRIFHACFEDPKKIPHMGVSALGEMAGWAMPDDFPPRNGRTSKALTALGFPVTIHSQ